MVGSIVQERHGPALSEATTSLRPVDPLSEVLALLKLESLLSGGFAVPEGVAISFPAHQGIKCYAMLSGECWLTVDTVLESILLRGGDCFILPRGLPFLLTTDLSLKPVHYAEVWRLPRRQEDTGTEQQAGPAMAGGFFRLTAGHAELLLQALPPVVHIRREEDKAAMRWCLERMRGELHAPKPGGALIAQQLAYMMLVQALRIHLNDAATSAPGWLSALADKQMSAAIACMHTEPGHAWTLASLAARVGLSRSGFAQRFRAVAGTTPMEYLTRWRMLLAADRLRSSREGISAIAQSLGYKSESAFGKAFRRVMGRSPRQYGRA